MSKLEENIYGISMSKLEENVLGSAKRQLASKRELATADLVTLDVYK
jgi:hypothetical protein